MSGYTDCTAFVSPAEVVSYRADKCTRTRTRSTCVHNTHTYTPYMPACMHTHAHTHTLYKHTYTHAQNKKWVQYGTIMLCLYVLQFFLWFLLTAKRDSWTWKHDNIFDKFEGEEITCEFRSCNLFEHYKCTYMYHICNIHTHAHTEVVLVLMGGAKKSKAILAHRQFLWKIGQCFHMFSQLVQTSLSPSIFQNADPLNPLRWAYECLYPRLSGSSLFLSIIIGEC